MSQIESIKAIPARKIVIYMQLAGDSEFGWIINIAFLAFIVLFSLYGAKLQIWQWLKQIEAGLIELKRMHLESRQTAINTFKKYGKEETEVAEELDRWLDYFTIMPVDLDPAGVLKRLDHLLDERRDRFQEFVADLAPNASASEQQSLENTLEVTQVLHLIFRIVRHFYILGKKTNSQLVIMQVQMQLPEIMQLAKAYYDALDAFSEGKPIGDGIGPLVVTKFAREYDKVLIRQLLDYILDLSKRYTLYVSLGRLKNIRYRARKGNGMGRSFRGMIHSWAFSRITMSFRHGLAQLGWSVDGKNARFQAVPESWTSIMCWKCGRKGIRPKQNLFICPTCGNKCNADMNGAINIAARLITLTSSLHGVGGRGKWMDALLRAKNPRPKARGIRSHGKSLLSTTDPSSGSGESAAVHLAQSSLADLGDRVRKGDDDLAVVSTVESLSAAGNDGSALAQGKEARSIGGISSQ